MSPTQPQTTPAPVAADIYSESLEQQFAIVQDFLLSPLGAALLANDPWVRRRAATPAELARHVAARVYRSKPFFVTTAITHAIFSASRSLPDYTFTAESFPCPKAFVWLQEPICLYEGRLFPRRVMLHAFHWYLDKQLEDEQGRIPVLFDGYLVDADRPKGVPTFHVTVNLGWTLDEHYGAQTSEGEQQSKRGGDPGQDDLSDLLGPVFVRFVASCLSFMEQRITIPVGRPASRATRHRLERKHATLKPESEVQVIELRRRERRGQEHSEGGGQGYPRVARPVAGRGALTAPLVSAIEGAQAALHRTVCQGPARQTTQAPVRSAVRGQALTPHTAVHRRPSINCCEGSGYMATTAIADTVLSAACSSRRRV